MVKLTCNKEKILGGINTKIPTHYQYYILSILFMCFLSFITIYMLSASPYILYSGRLNCHKINAKKTVGSSHFVMFLYESSGFPHHKYLRHFLNTAVLKIFKTCQTLHGKLTKHVVHTGVFQRVYQIKLFVYSSKNKPFGWQSRRTG